MVDYGITPAQYHAGLDKLWAALGLTGVQNTDVFTLAAERIRDSAFDHRLAMIAAERCRNEKGPCWCGCHITQVQL